MSLYIAFATNFITREPNYCHGLFRAVRIAMDGRVKHLAGRSRDTAAFRYNGLLNFLSLSEDSLSTERLYDSAARITILSPPCASYRTFYTRIYASSRASV